MPQSAVACKPDTWYNKGITLDGKGDYDQAILCYNKAIELDPTYGNAWYNKSKNTIKIGNIDDALSYLRKAIELDLSNLENVKTDGDFDPLRKDARFINLISSVE